ncbi:hypothetical protein ACPXB3_16425 [Gordonia sp. DT219]|uniref:hypothetical protein n=1 Tax=Gordonia sp. DT219 TaxID=3416658 RepID=UPI003CFB716D
MANLTITVDDKTLKRARIRAIERGESVNQYLAQRLIECADGCRRFPSATRGCRLCSPIALVEWNHQRRRLDARRTLRRAPQGRSVTVFLDTNLIAYQFDDSFPDKQSRARDLFGANATNAVVSTQVLIELHSVLTRQLGRTRTDAARILDALPKRQPGQLRRTLDRGPDTRQHTSGRADRQPATVTRPESVRHGSRFPGAMSYRFAR